MVTEAARAGLLGPGNALHMFSALRLKKRGRNRSCTGYSTVTYSLFVTCGGGGIPS